MNIWRPKGCIKMADLVTVLHYGEILSMGPPVEIRQNQAVNDAYPGEVEV